MFASGIPTSWFPSVAQCMLYGLLEFDCIGIPPCPTNHQRQPQNIEPHNYYRSLHWCADIPTCQVEPTPQGTNPKGSLLLPLGTLPVTPGAANLLGLRNIVPRDGIIGPGKCVAPKASNSAPEDDERTPQNKRNIEHVQIILIPGQTSVYYNFIPFQSL